MKYYFIFIWSISMAGFSQITNSSCTLNDTIAGRYKKDADRLAIHRVFYINSLYKDSVIVDATMSDKYLKALIAVYNATLIPARDSALKICNIHTNNLPDMNKFEVVADSNNLWMKNLKNNILPTGNPILDKALTKYNLQKINYTIYPNLAWHVVRFNTNNNINGVALGNSFYSIVGLYQAGPVCCVWDGSDITDSIYTNYIDLKYQYKWFDCIDGCDNIHWWKFRVYDDCTVEFKGSFGQNLPLNVGINQEAYDFSDVKIFPNPTRDKFILQTSRNTSQQIGVLINVFGQHILNFPLIKDGQEIDISAVPNGVYYFRLENKLGQKTFKIVKN